MPPPSIANPAEEPEWIAQARTLIEFGADPAEVASYLGKSEASIRHALDIGGARTKQKARVCASRARERAERVGIKPRSTGRKLTVEVNEDRISARSYAEPKPAPPLTLPRISLPDIDEPRVTRLAPKPRVEDEKRAARLARIDAAVRKARRNGLFDHCEWQQP